MTSLRDTNTSLAQNILGHDFQDTSLLWEALQVAGSGIYMVQGRNGQRLIPVGNKRLAVYGDAAIANALSRSWFWTGASQGEWTAQRANVLGNDNLARVGESSGLAMLMNVNPSNPVRPSTRLVATLVEAVLGAVDMDGGMEALKTAMVNIGLVDFFTQVTFNISIPPP